MGENRVNTIRKAAIGLRLIYLFFYSFARMFHLTAWSFWALRPEHCQHRNFAVRSNILGWVAKQHPRVCPLSFSVNFP